MGEQSSGTIGDIIATIEEVTEQVSLNIEQISGGTKSSGSASVQVPESARLPPHLSEEMDETASRFKVGCHWIECLR